MSGRSAKMYADGDGRWLDWRGAPVRLLSTGDDTDGAMTVEVGYVDIGDGPPPHLQTREDEGFYVLAGKLEFNAGTEIVHLGPGDFINIRSQTAHTFVNVGLEEAKLVTINAPAGFDAFQLKAGKEVDGTFDSYDPDDEKVEEMEELAHEFGITVGFDLDSPEFSDPPQITVRHAADGEQVNAVGDRYRFLVESAQTGGRYALWHATVGPGGGPPLHRHSKEEEAFFILKGEVCFESDGEESTLGAGGFVNLPRGTSHRFQNRGDEPAEMLILVAPAGLETMFRKTGQVVEADAPIAPPSEEEIAKLKSIAPDYGIEILDGDH